MSASRSLRSCSVLRSALGQVRVLDSSWYLSNVGRDARKEFLEARIPTAQYFDLDAVSDTSSALPHMMPSKAHFERSVEELGVSNSDDVFVYDSEVYSCFRVWWMFRYFGHQNVFVLDGGLAAWKAFGFPLESGPITPPPRGSFKALAEHKEWIVSYDELLKDVRNGTALPIDARPQPRFEGKVAEPRPSLLVGHIPGAISMPWSTFLQDPRKPELGLKKRDDLKQMLSIPLQQEQAGKKIVTYCGSGTTAAFVNFALDELGHKPVPIYDGSWAEWGNNPTAPVEKS